MQSPGATFLLRMPLIACCAMRLAVATALILSAVVAMPATGAPDPREPTVRTETSVSGAPQQVRTWEFGVGEVGLRDLTIAEADYLWLDYPADQLELVRGRLECPVTSGEVQVSRCLGSCSDDSFYLCGSVIGTLARLGAVRFPELPHLEASDGVRDQVSIAFELDPHLRPKVDLGRGEMRDWQQIVASTSRVDMQEIYPPRAIRQGVEGRMTVSCQVQADISVICRQKAFDPPEHAPLFERAAVRLGPLLDVKSELPDGSSTAGSRFERVVGFRLS